MKDYIVFCEPEITTGDIQAVVDTLKTKWIGKGKKTVDLENIFKSRTKAAGAVGVNSCTAALFLSLKLFNIGLGDEVITTPITFAASANVIVHVGAKPVFVDVDKNSFNIDAKQIEVAITKKTKAIIVVHLAGRPCEMDEIMRIANKYSLRVIEDCAHAIESKYKGQQCGSLGDTACFSFYATKNMTCGEGGMLVLKNAQNYKRMAILSSHGLTHNAWDRYNKEGVNFYEVLEHGYKYNMHDISATLALSQYSRLESNWKKRQANWNKYMVNFKNEQAIVLPTPIDSDCQHAYHLFTILLDIDKLNISRNEFCILLKEKNIGSGINFLALHQQPAFKKTLGAVPALPNAEFISARTVSLPVQPTLTNNQIDYVIKTVKEIITTNLK